MHKVERLEDRLVEILKPRYPDVRRLVFPSSLATAELRGGKLPVGILAELEEGHRHAD